MIFWAQDRVEKSGNSFRCASAIFPVSTSSSCVTLVLESLFPCSSSTFNPILNCSTSNLLQSIPRFCVQPLLKLSFGKKYFLKYLNDAILSIYDNFFVPFRILLKFRVSNPAASVFQHQILLAGKVRRHILSRNSTLKNLKPTNRTKNHEKA